MRSVNGYLGYDKCILQYYNNNNSQITVRIVRHFRKDSRTALD